MRELMMALLTGLSVGLLFSFLRLPIPAPPALAGVVGIFGIYMGLKIFEWIRHIF